MQSQRSMSNDFVEYRDEEPTQDVDNRTFQHQRIDLTLRRDIVSLADPKYHKPKPNYVLESKSSIPFSEWFDSALVSISPNADLILFAAHCPEKIVFLAKLRVDPINQYVTKSLDISLDYDEEVTSLLCLPFMSTQKTAMGLVDWTTLVVGFSSGYVNFYTEQAICLLSLKFSDEPVISIKCQTQKMSPNGRSECHFATISDELLIVHKTEAILVDGISLYENLRIAKDEVVRNGFNYEPAYKLANLPSILNCQKWCLANSRMDSITDVEILGTRLTSAFDSLKSESINSDNQPAKTCGRALGVIGNGPFISLIQESKDTSSYSYTEIIGSIFSLWNKPEPSRAQMLQQANYKKVSIYDDPRVATSIVSSPDKRLAAITDHFGRVMLVDVTNWIVIRLWKGYRSAQCGWIEVKRDPDNRNSRQANFLVIYAPKRGLLEVWSSQRGPRVAAFNVGKGCRLLYSGYRMFNMRNDLLRKGGSANYLAEQSYTTNCYLLNPNSEILFAIELPYTYSLYKYGDLKSRDHLLIGELMNAIQQDSPDDIISEILHRITLAETLQRAIKKIACGLEPTKVALILENLVNKIMRNYDNHSGEVMTNDDQSIIELCKRLLRLCAIYDEASRKGQEVFTLPDVNQRLIDHYIDHPQEVDQFAEQLGWLPTEVLRYLSLLSLERSYRQKKHLTSAWRDNGEPLAWREFISCFNLDRRWSRRSSLSKSDQKQSYDVSIELREISGKFLSEDRVIKTALLLYRNSSECYIRAPSSKSPDSTFAQFEPSSHLALLVQFWLSTRICDDWKFWALLQDQIGRISDRLKVQAMSKGDDRLLVDTWKQMYNLILESDNIFSAMIATAAIRSDTLRIIEDNQKRDKLNIEDDQQDPTTDAEDPPNSSERRSSLDWEHLCIDAERMSILSNQLQDVFLLNILLRYSVSQGHLVECHLYRIPRISVASILRGGATVISELIAQWIVQSGAPLKVITQPYGDQEESERVFVAGPGGRQLPRSMTPDTSLQENEEHAKELIHHVRTSFPCSLQPDSLLVHCIWEYCHKWATIQTSIQKSQLLDKAFECLRLMSVPKLRYRVASVAYKTFFQRAFERLVTLIESNGTMSAKNSRVRDTLCLKELNMSGECLDDFVQFCCHFSEFMMQACIQANASSSPGASEEVLSEDDDDDEQLKRQVLALDNWWQQLTPNNQDEWLQDCLAIGCGQSAISLKADQSARSLIRTALFARNLLCMDVLAEINRLANLVRLLFKLHITKAHPLTLIGEESRHILFDLQQSPPLSKASLEATASSKSHPLGELRGRFARKCIVSIVKKISESGSQFEPHPIGHEDDVDAGIHANKEDVDISLSRRRSDERDDRQPRDDTSVEGDSMLDETKEDQNESMLLFESLLSLASEWHLNIDELYLEFVFELYRCNHDKLGGQFAIRVVDQQTLAAGLLKIASQRVLVLFALSPHVSGPEWRRRSDKWSIFQSNVSSWLKSIQQEEMRREIACLIFDDSLKAASATGVALTSDAKRLGGRSSERRSEQPETTAASDGASLEEQFGLQLFVLHTLKRRTQTMLESITNHLDGHASRLAYDLLQVLESKLVEKQLL